MSKHSDLDLSTGPSDGDKLTPTETDVELLNALEGYRFEAENNRSSGMNPRDAKWEENLNLYWNRHDFSHKAGWQSKETMPEVPAFVDRFAAAMKEALVATNEQFYTITDPVDSEGTVTDAVKRMTDVWLSSCGKSQNGHLLAFPAVFEEQIKMGATTACCGVVTWKKDVPGGRVSFEPVDPRFVWLDHTFRNLYRIRRIEIDRHELVAMSGMKDFNSDQIDALQASISVDEENWRRSMTGHGQEQTSNRKPIMLEEYIATVVNNSGEIIADKALVIVANRKFIIRGPEKNPFWHGSDWMVYTPLITTPLSVYGRTYMEDFGSLATTFTELTNLIFDATYLSAMNAHAIVPSMLVNPEQIAEGLHPGMALLLEEGFRAEDFAAQLNLGTLDPAVISVWNAIKGELSEAAAINEIGLGQFAPKGRTSATEINAAQQNSSILVRSIAQTVEQRLLDPALDLFWKTGLQHVAKDDNRMMRAAGEDMFTTLIDGRRELIKHPFTFKARGISSLIQRGQMLQSLMQGLQVIGQNDQLTAAFTKTVDFDKLTRLLFQLSNVDMNDISKTEQQKQISAIAEKSAAAAAGAQPTAAGTAAVGGLANAAGIAKQS